MSSRGRKRKAGGKVKVSHSEKERLRRQTMIECYEALERLMPLEDDVKPKRTELLEMVISYIETMHTELEQLEAMSAANGDTTPRADLGARAAARTASAAAAAAEALERVDPAEMARLLAENQVMRASIASVSAMFQMPAFHSPPPLSLLSGMAPSLPPLSIERRASRPPPGSSPSMAILASVASQGPLLGGGGTPPGMAEAALAAVHKAAHATGLSSPGALGSPSGAFGGDVSRQRAMSPGPMRHPVAVPLLVPSMPRVDGLAGLTPPSTTASATTGAGANRLFERRLAQREAMLASEAPAAAAAAASPAFQNLEVLSLGVPPAAPASRTNTWPTSPFTLVGSKLSPMTPITMDLPGMALWKTSDSSPAMHRSS